MEVTLKRLTKNGAFGNEVLFLTQQKAYTFGRVSANDVVLFAPTVSKNHCIFHHNSDGLFVEVLKSLAGVVVNGKKYSTGSMVRLHNKDLVVIGLENKYQVEIKPIVQNLDTKNNFTSDFETDYEKIKNDDLSDVNIKNESELENATIDKDTHYEENSRSIQRDESLLSEASVEIKEEITLTEETQEITLDEIHSSMQITIDDEDHKPLIPLNSTGEPETLKLSEFSNSTGKLETLKLSEFSNSSGELKTLKLSKFSNFVRETTLLRRSQRMNKGILPKSCDVSFKNRVSEKSTHSNKQNRTSLKENEISKDQVSKNENKIEEQSRILEEKNIVSNNQTRITPERIFDGISRNQNQIVQERSSIGNSENAVKILQTHSVKNPPKDSLCPAMESLGSPSTLKMKSCQVEDKRLPQKRLFVTLIDIRKYPNSNYPPIKKLPSDSKNVNEKPKPTRNDTEERPFSCATCEKTFKKKVDVRYHLRIHSDARRQTCEICKKILCTMTALEYHMRRHTFQGKFKCKECPKLFFREHDLRRHKKFHTDPKQYNCPHCDRSYATKKWLTWHVKAIHTRTTDRDRCSVCDKGFPNKNKLEEHYRIHTGEKPVICQLCQKTFRGKKALRRHVRLWHEANFTCNECQGSFNNKVDLRSHLAIHFPRKPIICPDCGYDARHPSKLLEHRRAHTGERPFKCEVCDKAYPLKSSWKEHMMMHTGNYPYRCDKCGKGLTKLSQVKIHEISYCKDRLHICSVCCYSFRCESTWKRHYACHKSNVMKCEICHLELQAKKTLKKHYKKHLEIKGEFNCMVCKKEFKSQKDLIAHCQKTLDLWGKCPDN